MKWTIFYCYLSFWVWDFLNFGTNDTLMLEGIFLCHAMRTSVHKGEGSVFCALSRPARSGPAMARLPCRRERRSRRPDAGLAWSRRDGSHFRQSADAGQTRQSYRPDRYRDTHLARGEQGLLKAQVVHPIPNRQTWTWTRRRQLNWFITFSSYLIADIERLGSPHRNANTATGEVSAHLIKSISHRGELQRRRIGIRIPSQSSRFAFHWFPKIVQVNTAMNPRLGSITSQFPLKLV